MFSREALLQDANDTDTKPVKKVQGADTRSTDLVSVLETEAAGTEATGTEAAGTEAAGTEESSTQLSDIELEDEEGMDDLDILAMEARFLSIKEESLDPDTLLTYAAYYKMNLRMPVEIHPMIREHVQLKFKSISGLELHPEKIGELMNYSCEITRELVDAKIDYLR